MNFKELASQAKEDGIGSLVGGGVIIRNNKVLLLRRPPGTDYGGNWEIPSGHIEEGESIPSGAAREVREETGVFVNALQYCGFFDYTNGGTGKKERQFNFICFVDPDESIRLSEHDQYVWVKFEELDFYNVSSEVKGAIRSALLLLMEQD